MNDLSRTQRAKLKQRLLLVSVALVILLVASAGVYLTAGSTATPGATRKADIRTKSYIAPGEKIDPQDAWRGVSDKRLTSLEAKNAELMNELRMLKGQHGATTASGPTKSPEQMSDKELDQRLADYERTLDRSRPGYPAGTPTAPLPGQSPPSRPAGNKTPLGAPSGKAGGANLLSDLQGVGILTIKLPPPKTVPKIPSTPTNEKAVPERSTQNYLPSGMFGQAVLLAGLDAPTGGQAQSNPQPVLLQLRDPAILPNEFRYDWAKCLVTGAGYGDLSSERGFIRLESLSCVAADGKVLDVPLKGYVVGEDGKAGMRGRLVSKQGQVLGNALLAGVVAGIGTGLERSSTIQSISPLGSTTTTKPGHEFASGIGAGVGHALDRLADYYIRLADKMFPVIEIDAGRVVDVTGRLERHSGLSRSGHGCYRSH